MANIDYIKTAQQVASAAKAAGETAVDGVQKGVFAPSKFQAVASIVTGAVIAIACTIVFGIVGAIAAWGLFGMFILGVEKFQESENKELATNEKPVAFTENLAHVAAANNIIHFGGGKNIVR